MSTTTTTTGTRTTTKCPYANFEDKEKAKLIEEALNKCPAFASASSKCPFKDKNSSQIQEIFMTIPPSHYNSKRSKDDNDKEEYDNDSSTSSQRSLEEVLAHVHSTKSSSPAASGNSNYSSLNKCPFQSYHQEQTNEDFAASIEALSWGGMMAQIVMKSSEGLQLSAELKSGTKKSHRAAENVHFVRNFIKGKINRELYTKLVVSLYYVYSTLEEELDRFARVIGPLHRPDKLNRKQSLEADLSFFLGEDWSSKISSPSEATQDYMNRIKSIAKMDPVLLIAHGYTRYLGDLSGGRVLQRVAKRAMNLQDGKGLSFYEFENIQEGPKEFKNWYRKALDEMTLSNVEHRRLVAEANVAFVLNMRIFEELDVLSGDVEGSSVRPLKEALVYFDEIINEDVTKNANESNEKCPFGYTNNSNGNSKISKDSISSTNLKKDGSSRCPWPFVFLHDPVQGLKDWQTSVVLGVALCYGYKLFLQK